MKQILLGFIILVMAFNAYPQRVEHPDAFKSGSSQLRNYIADSLVLNYDVKFYHLDIAVSNTSEYIEGSTLIKSEVVNTALDTFAIQLMSYLTVDSVHVDGVNTSYNHVNDVIHVLLGTQIPVGNLLDVTVYYHGTCTGDGLSTDFYWGTYYPTTWTLSESFHAKDWFPCKEDLTDKADSTYIYVTVDDSLKVGSNGILENTVNLGGGKVRYEWKSRHPIAYYLISISVANYLEYNLYAHPAGLSDSILIQNYMYNLGVSWLGDINETVDLMELFSDRFGMYPFYDEKYGHCYAPLGGGMEHQTMTTMGFYDFWIVAHELAHQWFGDNVTCAHWQDIWVNEGFASYSEYIAFEFLKTQTEADDWMLEAHNRADNQVDGTVYIPVAQAQDEGRIFDYEMTYKKGAAIVHMIRFQLNNDSVFFQILKDFQTDFGDDVATGDDFRDYLFSKSSIDFTDFFDDWYYGYGYPTYDVHWVNFNDTLTIDVAQSTSSALTTFFCNDMEYLVEFENGSDSLLRVPMTQNNQSYEFIFTNRVSDIIIDPNNWILNGAGSVVNVMVLDRGENVVKIYPNPTKGNLSIEMPVNQKASIEILDISGKALYAKDADEQLIELNIDFLPTGIYYCRVVTENSINVEKITKL